MIHRAFTLIELLVTVAILALLAAILLPALARVREASRASACMSNMRNWGIGLHLYTNEQKGFIPRRGQGIQPVSNLVRPSDWFNALPPYVGKQPYSELALSNGKPGPGDKSLFICPSAEVPAGDWANFFPYAMNMYLSSWNRALPHNLREVSNYSELAFMADAPGPYSSTVPSKAAYSVVARHFERANLVFLDGHVETQSGEKLGCGVGIPLPEPDGVRWKTGTSSDEGVPY